MDRSAEARAGLRRDEAWPGGVLRGIAIYGGFIRRRATDTSTMAFDYFDFFLFLIDCSSSF